MRKLPQAPRFLQLLVLILLALPFIPILYTLSPFVFESGFTAFAFKKLFAKSELIVSLFRSLKIAFLSSILSLVIAALAAWRVEKHNDRIVSLTLHLSMALPEIVLGLSLLLSYSLIGMNLGNLTVALAHASFTYAFASLVIRSHAQNLDPKIFEAAKDLGATPFQSLVRITTPLFSSSLVSAFLLCMTLSLDDYLISAFTSGAGQDTLPMRIYGLLRYGFGPELKAVTLLLFGTSLIFVAVGLPLSMGKKKN
ncbi:MAG: ABC transporter permease subunit [Bdellovibrionota bacterium]